MAERERRLWLEFAPTCLGSSFPFGCSLHVLSLFFLVLGDFTVYVVDLNVHFFRQLTPILVDICL